MGLKSWFPRSYWLRGGLIVVISVAVLIIIYNLSMIFIYTSKGMFVSLSDWLYPIPFLILIATPPFFIIGAFFGLMFRIKRNWIKGGLMAAFIGFLIFWYDYDFFINVGGPNKAAQGYYL